MTERCREFTVPYCVGNGLDLGSAGDPVVPWAIQVELPESLYNCYQSFPLWGPVQWRGDARCLPFRDETMDFVYSSHLLEDFEDWTPVLAEWLRVLKRGGNLIVMVPDKERFNEAIRKGGGGNSNHKHEAYLGELTSVLSELGISVILEKFTHNEPSFDWNILFVGKKI